MMDITRLKFIDNNVTKNSNGRYICIEVDAERVIESWRDSVFSFEWVNSNGTIKSLDDLPAHEQPKRTRVEEALNKGTALEKPILGIGLRDNVEIGCGRAEFLTLAAQGVKIISVHIPKSNESDFKDFRADID